MGGEVYGSGGWAKYVRELATYLVKNNYRVKILCRMGKIYTTNDILKNLNSQNITVSNFSKNSQFYTLMQHLPNQISVFLGAVKLLEDVKRESSCQKILHVHDVSSSLLIALLVDIFCKLPLAVQIHGFPIKEQYIKLSIVNSSLAKFVWFLTKIWHTMVVNFIKNNSVIVLVNNSEVKSFYESCGLSPSQIKIISSAIDLKEYEEKVLSQTDALTRLGIGKFNGEVMIGYVGGLRQEKNVGRLIKAFRDCLKNETGVKAKLLIIGDGPLYRHLKEEVNECNLRNYVFFLGFIPEAYRFLNAIDIFVLPSLSEGSPISLIEAMAAGKAIIASNIPSIREIVRHGEEAILVNPHNVEELKQAILLLYNNPDLRVKLGNGAKERAKLYDVNKVYGEILKLYEELARRKAKNTLQ